LKKSKPRIGKVNLKSGGSIHLLNNTDPAKLNTKTMLADHLTIIDENVKKLGAELGEPPVVVDAILWGDGAMDLCFAYSQPYIDAQGHGNVNYREAALMLRDMADELLAVSKYDQPTPVKAFDKDREDFSPSA